MDSIKCHHVIKMNYWIQLQPLNGPNIHIVVSDKVHSHLWTPWKWNSGVI